MSEISMKELAKIMLTADFGKKVLIHSDGRIETLDNSEYIANNCVILKTPGIGNLDISFFEEDFVKYDEEKGIYVELKTGRNVGTIEDVILECIDDGGDISKYTEVWEEEIEQQQAEIYENEKLMDENTHPWDY